MWLQYGINLDEELVYKTSIYKIGVTNKIIEEQIAELARSLTTLFDSVSIELLGN